MIVSDSTEALRSYYAVSGERGRLGSARAALEFERTKELIERHLPPREIAVRVAGMRPAPSHDVIVVDEGLGGVVLSESAVEVPWLKEYDAINGAGRLRPSTDAGGRRRPARLSHRGDATALHPPILHQAPGTS